MKEAITIILLIIISIFILTSSEERDYQDEVEESLEIIEENNFNKDYLILVDYSIHSGKNRMFLYNLKENKIEEEFLVAHGDGCTDKGIKSTPEFSNEIGSNCSSEGIGVIRERDYSNWGINVKYWIEGLEETNNNMQERVIVLHSWEWIPDFQINPLPIFKSQGCYTVSNNTMRYLDSFIKKQDNKNILINTFK